MAETKGSKTTASVYENKKGVKRGQVAFDLDKLGEEFLASGTGKLPAALKAEIEQAISDALKRNV